MEQTVKIALINSVILNGGDAGIVYGTRDALRRVVPGADVSVFAHSAGKARRWYPDLAMEEMPGDAWARMGRSGSVMRRTYPLRSSLGLLWSPEKRFLERLRKMDAVVYCGGGYVNDLYSTDVLFRIMKDTLGLKIPHMAYAQSFGPFFREKTARAASAVLSRFDAVTTRDRQSLDLLRAIGVRCNHMEFTADAAFAMNLADGQDLAEKDQAALADILEFRDAGRGAPLLFVSVREWRFPGLRGGEQAYKRYREQLRRFTTEVLCKTHWRICFISTCQGRFPYGFDDAVFAASLMNNTGSLDKDRIYICEHAFMPRSYPAVIARCADMVISMRMHFMIFSLMAGVPCIALAYEQKTHELARQAGVSHLCHDLKDFSCSDLWESLAIVMEKNDLLCRTISAAVARLRERSLENARIIRDLISG